MTGWTAQAELLADAIREPGFKAAEVTASAWRAGVHAEATHGLVGAALALTDGEAMGSLWAEVEPCPSDAVLLEHAAELEGAVTELTTWCSRMTRDCQDALEAAYGAAAAAGAAIAAAQAAIGAADSPQAAATAAGVPRRSRRRCRPRRQAEIADCEAALEILASVLGRLEYALKCLRQVPDDFAQHLRDALPPQARGRPAAAQRPVPDRREGGVMARCKRCSTRIGWWRAWRCDRLCANCLVAEIRRLTARQRRGAGR